MELDLLNNGLHRIYHALEEIDKAESLALAELGLIDEYEFVVDPRLLGHGPTLFAGRSKRIDLKLMGRTEFGSGAVAMRYEPKS